MIEDIFGKFLLQYIDKSVNYNYDKERKLGMVIVATKPSFWLPLVIKNAIDKITNANLYFFGTVKSIELVKEISNEIQCIRMDDFNEIKIYNILFLSSNFWRFFNEEYLLIFQPDCILLRDLDNDIYNYDYIGPTCGDITFKDRFIINGGLSLRKTKTMIEICDTLSDEERNGNYNEDIILTKKLREHVEYSKKLPSFEVCNKYFIESIGNINTAVGIHGTDKYYLLDDSMKKSIL